MPEIVVFTEKDNQGSHLAAGVMGAMLAQLSEPIAPSKERKTKAEKTLPRNTAGLTVRQHVFPSKSIARFANNRGRIALRDIDRRKSREVKPSDFMFCARRAWDQRAEAGYMKQIEDEFQQIVGPIIDRQVGTIATRQKPAIDRMFALSYMRARYRELDSQETQLFGITGDNLTKDQEETLEKKGCLFSRAGGMVPSRQLNGLQLQRRIDGYAADLGALSRWGVIGAQSGEFIVPDVPSYTIIPLSPQLALAADSEDGIILEENVVEINRAFKASSQHYFFARDFSCCPL